MSVVTAAGPGFAQPVIDSQTCFRALLDAMARPGRIVHLAAAAPLVDVPGLSPAAAAVALSLCDLETPVWLAPDRRGAGDWLRFHCGALLVESGSRARFAFASGPTVPPLDSFDLGTDEFPDRSITLVIDVTALGDGASLTLSGPGIDGKCLLAVSGLDPALWIGRAALEELFPRGVDLVLTTGMRLVAVPRSTRVEP